MFSKINDGESGYEPGKNIFDTMLNLTQQHVDSLNLKLDSVLIPMFEISDNVHYNKKLISEYNYIVGGQVCIDKDYRGQGLPDNSYAAYKNYFKEKYDFAITEIATTNTRSINAHKRIGFFEIHRYTGTKNIEWSIVIWDWK